MPHIITCCTSSGQSATLTADQIDDLLKLGLIQQNDYHETDKRMHLYRFQVNNIHDIVQINEIFKDPSATNGIPAFCYNPDTCPKPSNNPACALN